MPQPHALNHFSRFIDDNLDVAPGSIISSKLCRRRLVMTSKQCIEYTCNILSRFYAGIFRSTWFMMLLVWSKWEQTCPYANYTLDDGTNVRQTWVFFSKLMLHYFIKHETRRCVVKKVSRMKRCYIYNQKSIEYEATAAAVVLFLPDLQRNGRSAGTITMKGAKGN